MPRAFNSSLRLLLRHQNPSSSPTRQFLFSDMQVRSSKATTSGSRSNGKTRPMSAPAGGGGFRCRSSCNHRHRTPPMLIPSLEGIPTSSMSLAELEAYATLPRRSNFNGESSLGASSKRSTLLGKSRSAGVIDGARCPRNSSSSLLDGNHYYDKKLMTHTRRDIITAGQQEKSSKIPPQVDALFDRLERLGPTSTTYTQPQLEPHGAASSATLTRSTMATANSRRAVDDAHIAAARHRQGSGGGGSGGGRARVQDLDGCRAALAEHLAARKRENELGRSDVSIRCAMYVASRAQPAFLCVNITPVRACNLPSGRFFFFFYE